jgi:hypothetical protein
MKRMELKFLELQEIALCPVGWPLGRIQLATHGPVAGNRLQPVALLKLSSQQLKRAAHIKARIEKLELRLALLLESGSGLSSAKPKPSPTSPGRSQT